MTLPNNMTLQATVENSAKNSQSRLSKRNSSWSEFLAWPARILLLAVLVFSPWMIGSVQHWAQYWLSLALLAGLGFWWFDTAVSKRKTQVVPYVALFVFLGLGIGLLQTVSLSDSLASTLLGRQIELYQDFASNESLAAVDPAEAEPNANRISLDTEQTWHMIRLLVMALSALLLGCRYFRARSDLTILFAVMTVNGVALSFFGIVQKLSFNGMLFWQIELTKGGQPFGPFVNRNNSGGFLLICLACAFGLFSLLMVKRKSKAPPPIISKEIPFWRQVSTQLLYFVSELTAPKMAVLISIVFIASGIASSLSRGAVLGMLTGGLATLVVYGVARRPKNIGFVALPLFLGVVALTSWVGFGEQLIERFENLDTNAVSEDARISNWRDTSKSINEMGLFGSGLGAYRSVHRIYRSDREMQIFEYAENQYFQSLIDAGWPGLILYLGAWLVAILCMKQLMFRGATPSSTATGIMAVFLLGSQSVTSFFDFGFYISANMLNLAVVIGVLSYQAHSLPSRIDFKSWLGFEMPNFGVSVMIVVVFGAITVVALDLHRKSGIDTLIRTTPVSEVYRSEDLATTNNALDRLGELAKQSPSVPAMNRLGDLWVQRARLEYVALLESLSNLEGQSAEAVERLHSVWWSQTNLTRIYENKLRLKNEYSDLSAQTFLENGFIQNNLPTAKKWYRHSLRQAPLQPWAHVRIGQINSILGNEDLARQDFERAVQLAPTNTRLLLRAAHMYLAGGKLELAAPHLRRYLELSPGDFARKSGIMELLIGATDRRVPEYDASVVLDEVVPDDPTMLYSFALRFSLDNEPVRKRALERASTLLQKASISKRENIILHGKVYQELGQAENALEQLGLAIRSDPGDLRTRFLVAKLQFQEGMLDDALENAEKLVRYNNRHKQYKQLRDSIKNSIESLKDE